MVRADPELASKLKIVDSTKTIAYYGNGSVYRAVSSESGTKHGLNPTVVIYDELAQAKSRDLYDVMDTSMGGRDEPLFIVISTQSNDPMQIMSQLIDDALLGIDSTIVCHLYTTPEDMDPFDEAGWPLSNPALGDFRNLDDFRSLADKAKRMPSEEAKFRNLFLNQRVSSQTSLIPRATWMACAGKADFDKGEDVYLALDLSSVNDLSALAMLSAHGGSRLKTFFWKPQHWLREHSNRDFGHGNWRYEEWVKAGWMEATDGKVINHAAIARKIAWIMQTYNVISMAYDRHKIDYLMRDLAAIDIQSHKESEAGDGLTLVPWGQGFVSMAPAIDAFESAVTTGDLIHDNNPVLNNNIANAISVMDPAGNRKLDKEASRFRIDGAVTVAMVVGLKYRDLNDDQRHLNDFLKSGVMA